jgi:nitroreductase
MLVPASEVRDTWRHPLARTSEARGTRVHTMPGLLSDSTFLNECAADAVGTSKSAALAGKKEQDMRDAIDLLKTRRSVKPVELAGPGPTSAELETLLTVASRVPDHGKLVPWRFIVFDGEARAAAGEAIAKAFVAKYPTAAPDQIEFERKRLSRAPLVVAVVSRAAPHVKIPEWEQVLSAGAAAMSLVFAAHALGFAANWITEWYAYDRAVLDALGLKPHEKIAGFVHIGRPAQRPEDRPRPALTEIVTRYGT